MRASNFKAGVIIKGTVVGIDDPRKINRIRVRIPILHGTSKSDKDNYIEDDYLPWVDNTESAVFDIGTRVYVGFVNDDKNLPVCLGRVLEGLETNISGCSIDGDTLYNNKSFKDIPYKRNKYFRDYVYLNRKGDCFYVESADDKEHISIVSRVGSWIKAINPITKDYNSSNNSKRSTINKDNIFSKLKGNIHGWFIRNVGNSVIQMIGNSGKYSVTLTASDTVGVTMKDSGEVVVSNSKISIKISGEEAVVTNGSSSIKVGVDSIDIISGKINIYSSEVNVNSDVFVHNGNSADFNSLTSLNTPSPAETKQSSDVENISISDYDKGANFNE